MSTGHYDWRKAMTNGRDPRQLSIPKFPQLKPVPERLARCKNGHTLIQYEYSPDKFAPVRCYICPPGEFRPNLEPVNP